MTLLRVVATIGAFALVLSIGGFEAAGVFLVCAVWSVLCLRWRDWNDF